MKLNVYSLYDRAAMTYGHPFYALNDAVAIRIFRDSVVRRESSMLRQHPDDFELRHIASFDDENGSFESALCMTLDTVRAALQYWDHVMETDPQSHVMPRTLDNLDAERPEDPREALARPAPDLKGEEHPTIAKWKRDSAVNLGENE